MKVFIPLAFALGISSAIAQPAEPIPCIESSNTVEKNLCLGREVEAQDKLIAAEARRVAAVWRVRDKQEPVVRAAPAFLTAHAKWRQYRDSECMFRSLTFGSGTGAPAADALCQIELGRLRLAYLQGLQ